MAKVLSEKAQAVLSYVQAHEADQPTAATIAEALGLEKKSVNGTLTGLQKDSKNHPPLTTRTEVENIEGKVIGLTAAGRDFDVNADIPTED